MVFRNKESRQDSFQRQISALRQQLSTDTEDEEIDDDAEEMPQYASSQDTPGAFRYSPSTSASAPAAPRTGGRMADSATGVIAAGSTWNGTMRSEGSIQVFGQVDGELAAGDEIFVAEGAEVRARMSGRTIVVAGRVEGTVDCHGRLEVMPSGHVSGDVTSATLVVHEGATVDGDVKMRAAETPAS